MERRLQANAVRWLRDQGAYVVKLQAGPGVPVGAPDVAFFYKSHWGVIEFKASDKAKFQLNQLPTLGRLQDWNDYVYVAYPDNWQLIQKELIAKFF
jgi:Holliday junction resolvase